MDIRIIVPAIVGAAASVVLAGFGDLWRTATRDDARLSKAFERRDRILRNADLTETLGLADHAAQQRQQGDRVVFRVLAGIDIAKAHPRRYALILASMVPYAAAILLSVLAPVMPSIRDVAAWAWVVSLVAISAGALYGLAMLYAVHREIRATVTAMERTQDLSTLFCSVEVPERGEERLH